MCLGLDNTKNLLYHVFLATTTLYGQLFLNIKRFYILK